MSHHVAITAAADSAARTHLLQHYDRGHGQEDLCFALWRPSTGRSRLTGIIDELVLPMPGETELDRNASFVPAYLARAIRVACARDAGLALMHSHPTAGWQAMSAADVAAERDVLAYAAGATSLPFLGLTMGVDGYWSARFWIRDGATMTRHRCAKVRVVGPNVYRVFHDDAIIPPPPPHDILRRTFDSWGHAAQNTIARLHVGIVGLGSVGAIVAETLARIGVDAVTFIDPDHVEEHNLDRLLFASRRDIGRAKVDLAADTVRRHATARHLSVTPVSLPIQTVAAYKAALDCDLLFSCVDRPVPRDVLNYIAHAHLIPVIDGGIAVELNPSTDRLEFAHWRAHIITPYHQCMRCNGQYNSSMVLLELDGSLDDPSYIATLPSDSRYYNQNVFPFSLASAAMEVNLFVRYIISRNWWPVVKQQDYQLLTGKTRLIDAECHPHCSFRARRARGDSVSPPYLTGPSQFKSTRRGRRRPWQRIRDYFGI